MSSFTLNSLDAFNFESEISNFEDALDHINKTKKNPYVLGMLLGVQKKLSSMILDLFKSISNDGYEIDVKNSYTSPSDSHKRSPEEKGYDEFLENVNCSFCSQVLPNKVEFIKHIDEDCVKIKTNMFQEQNKMAYSFFQILPNNAIKCNVCPNLNCPDLKIFFEHQILFEHKQNVFSLMLSKACTNDVFCSCCKVLVPNTYIQISCHIKHKHHNKMAKVKDNKKTNHIYVIKMQKIKCLACSMSFDINNESIRLHCEKKKHKMNCLKSMYIESKAYCELCKIGFDISKLDYHCTGLVHMQKKEIGNEEFINLHLCFYCEDKCINIKEFAKHLQFDCLKVQNIRKSIINKNNKCNNKNALNDLNKSQEFKQKNQNDKIYLIVKCNLEVPDILHYFEKFGEISGFKKCDSNTLIIEFVEAQTVKSIMLLEDLISINDSNVSISEFFGPSKLLQSHSNEKTSVINSCTKNNIKNSSHMNEGQLKYLEILFEKVLTEFEEKKENSQAFLMNNKILSDFIGALKCSNCEIVGFGSCLLPIKDEHLEIYFDFKAENIGRVLPTVFCHKLLQDTFTKVDTSKLFSDVKLNTTNSIPHITCKHIESGKTCSINFTPFTKIMTDNMRQLVTSSEVLKKLFIFVKLWLHIHEKSIGTSDYPLIALLLFFLKVKCKVRLLLEESDCHKTILRSVMEDYSYEECKKLYVTDFIEPRNPITLFSEYLHFLKNFDFKKYVICLPFDCPVPKSYFTTEIFKFTTCLSNTDFISESLICIMDDSLTINVASDINDKDFSSLLEIVSHTIDFL